MQPNLESVAQAPRPRSAAGACAAIAAAALAIGYAAGAGREASVARAAGEPGVTQNVRLIAVPEQGSALVIDQTNRIYRVKPFNARGEPEAVMITDERGQPLLVR